MKKQVVMALLGLVFGIGAYADSNVFQRFLERGEAAHSEQQAIAASKARHVWVNMTEQQMHIRDEAPRIGSINYRITRGVIGEDRTPVLMVEAITSDSTKVVFGNGCERIYDRGVFGQVNQTCGEGANQRYRAIISAAAEQLGYGAGQDAQQTAVARN